MLLDESGVCHVPWEVLQKPLASLEVGVYGTRDDTVLPTIWANLGMILPGASPGKDAQPHTPDLWQQELAGKGDRLDYTEEGKLGLYAEGKLLSAVPVESSVGEGKYVPVPGPQGEAGQPGQNATINGETTLQIVAGDNVFIEQKDGTLTVSAAGDGITMDDVKQAIKAAITGAIEEAY